MTIRFELLVKGTKKGDEEYLREYCCFGGISNMMSSSKSTDEGYVTKRKFPPKAFQGIRLHLDHTSPYGQGTTQTDRENLDSIMRRIGVFDWMKGWTTIQYDQWNYVESIVFKPECPMFLVVVAASFYRLFDNAPRALDIAQSLTHKGISAVVAFQAAMQVDGYSVMYDIADPSVKFQVTHRQTHMPWGWRGIDVRLLKHITTLTRESFESLSSMYDEQEETGGLMYSGRDFFMFGAKTTPPPHGSAIRRLDPAMKYLDTPAWQKKWCTVEVHNKRCGVPHITGAKLLAWCREMDMQIKLMTEADCSLKVPRLAKQLENAASKKAKNETAMLGAYGYKPIASPQMENHVYRSQL